MTRHLHLVPSTPRTRATGATATARTSGPGPLPVVVDIARLLRALPPPVDDDPMVFRRWLAGKADLFDRVADAAADEALAADARSVAAAARRALASLALPIPPALAGTPSSDLGGDAA